MATLDPRGQSSSSANDEPAWLNSIIAWLRANHKELEVHDKVQLVFNRSGDKVQADYVIKSIKVK